MYRYKPLISDNNSLGIVDPVPIAVLISFRAMRPLPANGKARWGNFRALRTRELLRCRHRSRASISETVQRPLFIAPKNSVLASTANKPHAAVAKFDPASRADAGEGLALRPRLALF